MKSEQKAWSFKKHGDFFVLKTSALETFAEFQLVHGEN
jgi:hypothetical protein